MITRCREVAWPLSRIVIAKTGRSAGSPNHNHCAGCDLTAPRSRPATRSSQRQCRPRGAVCLAPVQM
jgi:hypothetical protein